MVFNIKHMFGGEMVEEYIQKIYEELLKEEQNSAKRISDLQIHLKETQAMIHLLEETNDPNYESFTPRKVNSRNKQKIDELHAEMKELEEAIQQETDYHTQQMEKVEEAAKVLRQAKADVACRCDRNTLEEERYHTSLLETQENERQRISRELHDSTVQNLTAMVHMAELCSKLVDMDPIRCKLELNKMIKNLREIIDDTRKMIYNFAASSAVMLRIILIRFPFLLRLPAPCALFPPGTAGDIPGGVPPRSPFFPLCNTACQAQRPLRPAACSDVQAHRNVAL